MHRGKWQTWAKSTQPGSGEPVGWKVWAHFCMKKKLPKPTNPRAWKSTNPSPWKSTNPWVQDSTNPWTGFKLKLRTWNLNSPYPVNLHLEKSTTPHTHKFYKPVSCPVSCCFSPKQGQPSSWGSPNKSPVWGLLCSVTLWYSLAPGCQGTVPLRAMKLPSEKPSLQSCDASIGEAFPSRAVKPLLGKLFPSELQRFHRESFTPQSYNTSRNSQLKHLTWPFTLIQHLWESRSCWVWRIGELFVCKNLTKMNK